MSDIAIRVENLSKLYHLGRAQQHHDTPSTRLRTRLRDALMDPLTRITRITRREKSNSSNSDNSCQKPGENSSNSSNSCQKPEDLWALKDVSFDVKQGEVVGTLAPAVARRASAGVIGRNGTGESTLLKILARITEPTSGRAETFGGRVANLLDASRGTGSQSDPELILRLGSGPARTSAARERRHASRGHTAPAVCAGVHRHEINRKFDKTCAERVEASSASWTRR